MRRVYGLGIIMGLIAASVSIALAQSSARKPMAGESVAETVSVLDHIWLDAAYNHDFPTMKWLFADDFVEVHPGGEIVDGPKQIEQIRTSTDPVKEIHPDNIEVRYASSDVAVLTDVTTIRSQSGAHYNGTFRVIRVFVKQGGRWRAAGAGIVGIAGH